MNASCAHSLFLFFATEHLLVRRFLWGIVHRTHATSTYKAQFGIRCRRMVARLCKVYMTLPLGTDRRKVEVKLVRGFGGRRGS